MQEILIIIRCEMNPAKYNATNLKLFTNGTAIAITSMILKIVINKAIAEPAPCLNKNLFVT
jgi:hypothetical protein